MNIDFPFHLGGRGLTAATTDADHIEDMIEQLLFTNQGERVNRPDFGLGLLQMVFAPNSPEVARALQFSMQSSLQRWLGDLIELQSLEVRSEETTMQIVVQYLVRSSDERRTAQFTQTV